MPVDELCKYRAATEISHLFAVNSLDRNKAVYVDPEKSSIKTYIEGWIEKDKKDIEMCYAELQRIYMVFKKDHQAVGKEQIDKLCPGWSFRSEP